MVHLTKDPVLDPAGLGPPPGCDSLPSSNGGGRHANPIHVLAVASVTPAGLQLIVDAMQRRVNLLHAGARACMGDQRQGVAMSSTSTVKRM